MPEDGGRGKRQHVTAQQPVWRAAGYGPSLALLLLGASLLTLALLALRIREHRPPSWDSQVLRFLAPDRQEEPVRSTLHVFAEIGGEYRGLVPACLLVLGLVVLRRVRAAVLCALVVGTSLATVMALKPAFDRPPLIAGTEGYFPSGHAAGSLAVGAVIVLLSWPTRWRWPVLTVTLVSLALFGAALVYFRSHYPSDVVGGWCVALVWTCGLALLALKRDLHSGRELSLVREGPRLGHLQDDEEFAPTTGAIPLREE
jgi:membrane-associated phospholipid phosphatase